MEETQAVQIHYLLLYISLFVNSRNCTGDLTCLVTLEESQELEARLASREDFVAAGLAILPEAIKVMRQTQSLGLA